MASIVEQLRDDLAALDDAAVTERFRQLELEARRVEAETAVVVAEAKRRSLHHVDGHRSMAGWMRANANLSGAQVRRRRHLAELTDVLPEVADRLAAGHIGIAQAEQLAAVSANPRCGPLLRGSLDVLLEQAEQLPFDDAKRCLERWVMFADADGAHRQRELDHEHRRASVVEADGTVHAHASGGTALVAAELQAIFARFVQAEFDADSAERLRLHGPSAPTSALPRTDAQRRFDAMVALFRAAAIAPIAGRPAEVLMNLIMDQHTLVEELAAAGLIAPLAPSNTSAPDWSERRCETSDGTVLLPDEALRAAMHGYIRRVVVNGAGIPVDVGRRRRLFGGVARQVAHLLGYHCDQPGCTVPTSQCEIDHLDEWVRDNGRTDLDNAGPRCSGDNRSKQRLGHQVYRDPKGRPHTQRADGSWIHPVGQRQVHPRALGPPGDLLPPDNVDDLDSDAEIARLHDLARIRLAALR